MTCSEVAKEVLGNLGHDVRYGARPLQRSLKAEVLTPLSKMLLRGDVGHGGHVDITVDKELEEGGSGEEGVLLSVVLKGNNGPVAPLAGGHGNRLDDNEEVGGGTAGGE